MQTFLLRFIYKYGFSIKIIMDGYISKEDFKRCCYDICTISMKFQDNFVLRTSKDGDCYMVRKSIKKVNFENEETVLTDFEESFECQSITSSKCYAVTFEHHILYSESFNVPVLYFVAYCHDGTMLSLESIWNLVPRQHQHALLEKWSFISQQEHPELGCIYYYLHPCHTSNLMKNFVCNHSIKDKFKNYVLTWLSAVGPVACLDLELEYFK
ncbi:ubiquitin-like-conjugating enzyme ATG10 isoform X3 [Hydra vulgaris]|uniref:Ubiquitin-like-conjugating enzyme ATG10 n=1 Tax=Hydra vulgaris TaxID=6087 RepID=A0ABM4C6K6_HYDVU